MRLVNISNFKRMLTLFIRDENGNLVHEDIKTFFPYYYEPQEDGEFVGFDGTPLQKKYVSEPKDVRRLRSCKSFESDVIYTKRYLIDQIKEIEKTNVKFSFIDTETLSKTMMNPLKADKPFSCISSSNSYTNKISSFFLGDYDNEYNMIEAFIAYLKQEQFDLWLIWNGDRWDVPIFLNRIPDFSKRVSPIGLSRYGQKDMFYPSGISIVDYMLIDKKFTLNRKSEYSLEARLHEVLGRGKELKEVEWGKLSIEHKIRCENDVKDMVEFEKEKQYIPLLDGLRRLTKTLWEDYIFNSRYIDNLLLEEAKNKEVIMPMKPTKEDEGEEFEGAFRQAFTKGTLFGVGAYDLGGAYLNAIISLCLDPVNVCEEKTENSIPVDVTDRLTNKVIETYNVKQDPEALLPRVAKKLLEEKNKFKKLLKETSPDAPEFKDREEKYKAWKSLSLSSWGVIGNKYFRYYDSRTTSLITSIVRGILHYVIDKLKEKGFVVHYVDTDGIIIDDGGKDLTDFLNEIVKQWSMEKFGKEINIEFEYEGRFESLLILALTRYCGYLRTKSGLEKKTVGIETKRKDSTIFLKQFQNELVEKILKKGTEKDISEWIKEQLKIIRQTPLEDIAFPCHLSKEEYNKNTPIFVRALSYTQAIDSKFEKRTGERYFYIYVKPFGKEEKEECRTVIMTYSKTGEEKGFKNLTPIRLKRAGEINIKEEYKYGGRIDDILKAKGIIKDIMVKVTGKTKDVLAFDTKMKAHINEDNIDWEKMIGRNIHNKAQVIYDAMEWNYKKIKQERTYNDLSKLKKTSTKINNETKIIEKQPENLPKEKLLDNRKLNVYYEED